MSNIPGPWRQREERSLRGKEVKLENPGDFVLWGDHVYRKNVEGKLEPATPEETLEVRQKTFLSVTRGKER